MTEVTSSVGIVVKEWAPVHETHSCWVLPSQDNRWTGVHSWGTIVEVSVFLVMEGRVPFVTVVSNGTFYSESGCGSLRDALGYPELISSVERSRWSDRGAQLGVLHRRG